jgi:hypothetical protein
MSPRSGRQPSRFERCRPLRGLNHFSLANLGLAPQALFCRPLRGLRARPFHGLRTSLLRGAGCVVYHERRLQRRVFHAEEVDPNRLSLERSQIESLQRVASCLVQV